MPVSRRLKLSLESSDEDDDSSSIENIPLRATRSSKEPSRRSLRQSRSPKPKRKAPANRKTNKKEDDDDDDGDNDGTDDDDESEEEYVESSPDGTDGGSEEESSVEEAETSSSQATNPSFSSTPSPRDMLPCSSLTCLYKSKSALRKDMLVCAYQPCSKATHPPCLGFSPQLIKIVRSQSEWLCHDCKICAVCMKPAGEVCQRRNILCLTNQNYADDFLYRV